jgi:RNA polymerase sigma-70 factor (ECF subfamily)
VAEDGIDKLTAAMAAGDEDAVAAFYRRYFDLLLAHARRATRRDEAFCLDVVQDAVLRIIRTVKQVNTEPALLAWLKIVVQTTAFDLLRKENRRIAREVLVVSSRGESVEPENEEAHDEVQIAWLRQEITRLDPRLVRIIEMRYEQGWTLSRIGKALGLSTGAIDGRLRRVLSDLRKRALDDGVFDD